MSLFDLLVRIIWLWMVAYPILNRKALLDRLARPWIVNVATVFWEWAMLGPLFGHPLI